MRMCTRLVIWQEKQQLSQSRGRELLATLKRRYELSEHKAVCARPGIHGAVVSKNPCFGPWAFLHKVD